MAAKKYSVKIGNHAHVYAHNTDANLAFNNQALTVGSVTQKIRGFVGVRTPTSASLEGAFCWGAGPNLVSVVFALTTSGRNTSINFNEIPSGWSIAKAEKHVKALLGTVHQKLHDRMIARMPSAPKSKKPGGRYTGVRLEAHRRLKTLPKNQFSQSPQLFSKSFVFLAAKLHITYK